MRKILLTAIVFIMPFIAAALDLGSWIRVQRLDFGLKTMGCHHSTNCWALGSRNTGEFMDVNILLYKSSDQGRTWNSVWNGRLLDFGLPYLNYPFNASSPHPDYYYFGVNAATLDSPNAMFKSSDGGKSFKRINITDAELREIFMFSSTTGLVLANLVDGKWRIKVTYDAWESYEIKEIPPDFTYSIHLDKLMNIFEDGRMRFLNSDKGKYYITDYNILTDEWKHVGELPILHSSPYRVMSLSFINDSLGFGAGSGSLESATTDIIFKTTDGGKTISYVLDTLVLDIPARLQDISFFDEINGVAVGSLGRVWLTNDGGNNWHCWKCDKRTPDEFMFDIHYRPHVLHVEWAGTTPIIGTVDGHMYRYEGDFFVFEFDPPELIFPPNNSIKHDIQIDFKWSEIKEANDYIFQLSNDELFSDMIASQLSTTTNFPIETLEPFTRYYWRVGGQKGVLTKWSPTWTFRTKMPQIQTTSPECNAINQPLNIKLEWTPVKGAEYYRIELSNNSSFNNILKAQDSLTNYHYEISGLDPLKTYFWRVQAYRNDETGDWSELCYFTTEKGVGVSDAEYSNFITVEHSKTTIKFDIKEMNALPSNITISLYTINGNLLKSLNEQLTRGSNTYEMDISTFISGAYFYSIIIDNVPVKSGVFQIVR